MPEISSKQDATSTFRFHGMEFPYNSGGQANGDCPFCDEEKRFYVNREKGLWKCHKCDLGGNPTQFLRQLYESSNGDPKVLAPLAQERNIPAFVLARWGVRKSLINDEWLLPGYNAKKDLIQLYAYRFFPVLKRYEVRATPGMEEGQKHGLFGLNLFDDDKPETYLAEGFWDAAALWWVLSTTKRTEEGFQHTKDSKESLLQTCNVVAVPSAGTFQESWKPIFKGKEVWLCYDNDHEKDNPKTGRKEGLAGLNGMKRAYNLLSREPDKSGVCYFLNWGQGTDKEWNPNLKSGFDVRDVITHEEQTPQGRSNAIGTIISLLEPVPDSWSTSATSKGKHGGSPKLQPLECTSWLVLKDAWQKAVEWTEGYEVGFPAMLATVTSTLAVGCQLWIKLTAPPSTGKTVFAESLGVATKFIFQTDTIKSLLSGYQPDKEGTQNLSLVERIRNKTLIVKDADTILQAPNRAQIMSQLRALYDRNIRSTYANKMSKEWEGQNTTVILCGTGAMRAIDASELGDRFLDVPMYETSDRLLEEKILMRVAMRAERCLSYEANGRAEDNHPPEMARAMRLTGGYVIYLRENAQRLLDQTPMNQDMLKLAIIFGKFVAFARSRPSRTQDEVMEKEFAARLVEQFIRLSKCLAVVLQHPQVDEEIMGRVKRTALETAKGKSLDLFRLLKKWHGKGLTYETMYAHIGGIKKEEFFRLIGFLTRTGALHRFREGGGPGQMAGPWKWQMSSELHKLYTEVVGNE